MRKILIFAVCLALAACTPSDPGSGNGGSGGHDQDAPAS